MQRRELESITREWIGLWCAPVDWAVFNRLHADDFVDNSSAGRGTSKQEFALGLRLLIEAFPDLSTHVDDLVVDELHQRVAVRWKAIGTNEHEYLHIGPTHRRTTITGIEIIEIRKGHIVQRWGEWDIGDHYQSK